MNVFKTDHQNEVLDFQDEIVIDTIAELINLNEQTDDSNKDRRFDKIFDCDKWGDLELIDIEINEILGF